MSLTGAGLLAITLAAGSDVDLGSPDGASVIRIDRLHANTILAVGDSNNDGFDDLAYAWGGQARFYFGGSAYPPVTPPDAGSAGISGLDVGYEIVADARYCGPLAPLGVVTFPGWAAVKASVRNGPSPFSDYQTRLDCGSNSTPPVALGDLNGDGSTELWMGGVVPRSGYIMIGAVPGMGTSTLCPAGSTNYCSGGYIYRSLTGSGLDHAAWRVGDINGDQIDDLAFTDLSTVFLVHGNGTSVPTQDLDTVSQPAGSKILKPALVDGSVRQVSGGVDFDGDGSNDIAIAFDGSYSGISDCGAVMVVFGTPSGFPSVFDPGKAPADTHAIIAGAADGERFGARIAAVHDFNADGLGDLATMRQSNVQMILLGQPTRWSNSTTAKISMPVIRLASPSISGQARLQSKFDFNGDDVEDLLWHFGATPAWVTYGRRVDLLLKDGFESSSPTVEIDR